MIAVAMFLVSLTGLLYFLNGATGSGTELKANVVDSITVKAQQEKDHTYRSLYEDVDGPLVVLGVDGLIHFSSWDFETITGYKGSEIENQLFYSFIHPDDLEMFIGSFGKVLSTKQPVMMIGPYHMRNIDGGYKLHMASLYPIIENEIVVNVMISIRDITETLQPFGPKIAPQVQDTKSVTPEKKIRDTNNTEEKKLVVDKLAWLIPLSYFSSER